jgi:uncharacterized protein YyaL (SSP411 family)
MLMMTPLNRLAGEKSPYLLQHAGNPVAWHPWGDQAFERARQEDKPVFLSIGYSTCHWCHVMERESFEDEEVARALNAAFVCVKVDREERPDLDRQYMDVCQRLTGSGGWPLTVVMTPDKRPFFAGTYFPKARRFGRPGLLELVPLISGAWRTRRDDVLRSADGLLAAIGPERRARPAADKRGLGPSVLDEAFRELAADFDEDRGGFGGAPKFPIPHQVRFLLAHGRRSGNGAAAAMAVRTLEAMRRGGIYDHLGFGFHRYATDADWLLPHFEKMLYDQALLSEAYAEASTTAGRSEFARTASEIADYVLRDLTSPEGGFFTAEDADSEGEEGRFYLWTRDDLDEVLGGEEADLAARLFNVSAEGNFAEPGRAKDGRNILHLSGPVEGPEGTRTQAIESVRSRLYEARAKRVPPFKDTKVLADGNGLMISGLAAVHRATGEPRYLRAAERAADFVLGRMRSPSGRLLHVSIDGEARVPAFLDDYAFLIKGLVGLYEEGYEAIRLEQALALMDEAIGLFWDGEEGGFLFAEEDPDRPAGRKEVYDGAVPSGNSVMLTNLLRLARLTGRGELEDKSARLVEAVSVEVAAHPRAHTEFLLGLGYALGPSREVVVVGRREAPGTRALLAALRKADRPETAVLFKPTDDPEASRRLERLAPFTRGLLESGGRAAAYVCADGRCLPPVLDPAAFEKST